MDSSARTAAAGLRALRAAATDWRGRGLPPSWELFAPLGDEARKIAPVHALKRRTGSAIPSPYSLAGWSLCAGHSGRRGAPNILPGPCRWTQSGSKAIREYNGWSQKNRNCRPWAGMTTPPVKRSTSVRAPLVAGDTLGERRHPNEGAQKRTSVVGDLDNDLVPRLLLSHAGLPPDESRTTNNLDRRSLDVARQLRRVTAANRSGRYGASKRKRESKRERCRGSNQLLVHDHSPQ